MICSHFGKIEYLDEPTLLYRQHSGNMIGGEAYGEYVRERVSHIKRQRRVLQQTYRQGAAFKMLPAADDSGTNSDCRTICRSGKTGLVWQTHAADCKWILQKRFRTQCRIAVNDVVWHGNQQ